MFKQRNIITAIEIGTSKICVLVGECSGDTLAVIGRGEVDSDGAVVKGEIAAMDLALEKLIDALDQADDESGREINNSALFVIAVTGCAIDSFQGVGTAFVQNEEQRIGIEEVTEALRNAQIKPLPVDQKKICLFDAYYMIDGARRVRNPLDQRAHKLEAYSHVIHGDSNRLENFRAILSDAGLEGEPEMVFSSMADALGILTADERENGVLLVDLGAGTTEYAVVYNEGVLASGVFALGFEHVANDLAIGLNLPIANCRKMLVDKTIEQMIRENRPFCECRTNSGSMRRIPVESFQKIIDARLREIFELIYHKLMRESFWRNLAAGGVLTGGGALYFQTRDIFHQVCDLPSRIGVPYDLSGALTDLGDPRHSTVWGALRYGCERLRQMESIRRGGARGAVLNTIAEFGDVVSRKLKSWRRSVKF